MYILGINCYNAHDSAACIIRDGQLIAFAEEERFNRQKHTNVYPYNAVEYCLNKSNVSRSEKIIVGFYWQPISEIAGNFLHVVKYFPRSLNLLRANEAKKGFANNLFLQLRLPSHIKKIHNLKDIEFNYIEHHLAHAASTFFLSGFEDAAILTLDSRGESSSGILAQGKGIRIRRLSQLNAITQSLGNLYATFTDFLGFKVNNDEWKVMGLSAYGGPAYNAAFEKIIRLMPHGRFELDMAYFLYYIYGQKRWYSQKCRELFGEPRELDSPLEKRHEDIAFGLQYVLEKAALHIVAYLRAQVNSDNLCLAGGVALNCLMNAKILEQGGFKNLFIQPAAHDAGCSIGAAYYIYHILLRNKKRFKLEHIYLGPDFSNEEIEKILIAKRLNYRFCGDICGVAAKNISLGRILGWFQGSMEAGPRALGNRSILADPRRKEMKSILNMRVKHRESFRPFAPSVLEERYQEYFELKTVSPFMLFIAKVREEKRNEIPAVVHVDGTARVQTVSRLANPKFWEVIHNFERITGVPVVLNTSFNENEPIVCTPENAIECFLRTEMDTLCIGDFILEKEDQ